MNVNKVAFTKNTQPKKFQYSSQKHNINNHANFHVNKGKLRCYRCANSSHLANSYKYINTICNSCKKRCYLGKVCESNNSRKQMIALNTFDILSVSCDKVTTPSIFRYSSKIMRQLIWSRIPVHKFLQYILNVFTEFSRF